MILGRARNRTTDVAGRTTIDGLLRRAAETRPGMRALSDAPNRSHLIGGEARHLTWAGLDRTVDALAGRLRDLGIPTDAVVATQFALSTDAVVALLALSRADMIAAPVPLGWGRRETTAHLQRLGARAILTAGRIGPVESADMMRFAAADTFSVRFVLSIGGPALDGVVALDDIFDPGHEAEPLAVERSDNPADHVCLVTADATAEGHVAVARSHNELLAGGLPIFMTGVPDEHSVFAATLAPDCFAGIALQLVPWLMSGGTLVTHPPLAPRIVVDRLAPDGVTHAILPVAAAGGLLASALPSRPALRHLCLFSRRPVNGDVGAALAPDGVAVDLVYGFGETAVLRALPGRPDAVPLGPDSLAPAAGQAPVLAETQVTAEGELRLRGAMVPLAAFPPGAENGLPPFWSTDATGYRTTGIAAAADKGTRSVAVGSRELGVVSIGGRRFPEAALKAAYAEAGGEIAPVIRPDPVLGERVAGVVGDGRAIIGLAGRLVETGVTPLAIPGGTRQTGPMPFKDTRPPEALPRQAPPRESLPGDARPGALMSDDRLADAHSALAQLLSVARAAAGY